MIRNWLFGYYIVEFEQGSANRAELYGKRLIEWLSKELTAAQLGRGFSKRSLEQYRRFYEIEAYENSWGTRELERQIASSLYERLTLSRDKAGVKKLSQKGLVIEKPSDVVKNPYILEFLDLDEKSGYSEHELVSLLISNATN